MNGVQGLVKFLRENPGHHDENELSQRFGVELHLVRVAIQKQFVVPQRKVEKPVLTTKREGKWKPFLSRITANPVYFTIGFYACLTVLAIVLPFLSRFLIGAIPAISPIIATLMVLLLLGSPILHIWGIARHEKSRFAVLGGICYAAFFLILVAVSKPDQQGLPMAIFGAMMIGMLVMLVGSLACLAVAYQRTSREQKADREMSRQQMIDRILSIRSALESRDPEAISESSPKWLSFEWNWIVVGWAFGLGLMISIIFSVVMNAVDPAREVVSFRQSIGSQPKVIPGAVALSFFFFILNLAVQVAIGFVSSRFRICFFSSLSWVAGQFVSYMLPFSYSRIADIAALPIPALVFTYGLTVMSFVAGYFARSVALHSWRQGSKKRNDAAVLMGELIDLEGRLAGFQSTVAVMVVDVVGSTKMKSEVDPLVAEWTYRAYQEFVATTCEPFGGSVHATAGDGTILAFADPNSAFLAAQVLLRKLDPEFNAQKNRMQTPFQVRIGLHIGESQGELKEVQFTRLIDVAAHIEAKAPVGGIAASDAFIRSLSDYAGFEQTAIESDGHQVYQHRPHADFELP